MNTRFILPVLAGLFLLQALSGATDIRRIETEVWLIKNGNAVVQQTWDVNVTQGTEWYIPIGNLGQRSADGENNAFNWRFLLVLSSRQVQAGIRGRSCAEPFLFFFLRSYALFRRRRAFLPQRRRRTQRRRRRSPMPDTRCTICSAAS